MSKSVDERVVEMRFDNAKFEKNVQTSLGTLDKLKKSLDFTGSQKSFENLEKTANHLDFSELSSNIQKITDRFSTLGIAGDQIIRRLTDSLYNLTHAFSRTIKSITIDQVTAGWQKYADKTSAVQTIMASTAKDFTDTGKQMEYVNEQIERLNWFTDETSYEFLSMVSNIGKFTSANVALETAVTAMQGIANWAAISGANASTASQAMYQMSQAIGTGYIATNDWVSIETRNMSTTEFKQMALDIAVADGKLKKLGDDLYQTLNGHTFNNAGFRNFLSDKWFTSDIFLKTLDKYGAFTGKLYEANMALEDQYNTVNELIDDIRAYKKGSLDLGKISRNTGKSAEELTEIFEELSSAEMDLGFRAFVAAQEAKTFQEALDSVKTAVSTGWMNSFELIFGNYDEAKKLWTNVANDFWNIFASGAEGRNTLLESWHNAFIPGKDITAYEAFAEAIHNILSGVANLRSLLNDIFESINLGLVTSDLVYLTNKFYTFSESFRKFFDGKLLNPDGFGKTVEETVETVSDLINFKDRIRNKNSDGLRLLDGGEEELINKAIRDEEQLIEKGRMFQDVLSGIAHLISLLGKGIKTLQNSLEPLSRVQDALDVGALKIGSSLGRLFGKIDDGTSITNGFRTEMEYLANKLVPIINVTSDFISKLIDVLAELYSGEKTVEELAEQFSVSKEVIESLKKTFEGFGSAFGIVRKGITYLIKGIPGLLGLLGNVGEYVLTITGIIGEGFKKLEEGINTTDGFQKVVEKLARVFETLKGILTPVFDKIKDIFKTLIGYITSGDFAGLKNLIDAFLSTKLLTLIIYYTDVIGDSVRSIADIGWSIESNFETSSLLKIGAAIYLLALAFKKMSEVDSAKLSDTVVGMGALFAELAGFFAVLKGMNLGGLSKPTQIISGNTINGISTAILKISLAMLIFASALKSLAKIDSDKLYNGVAAVGLLLAILSLFFKSLDLNLSKGGLLGKTGSRALSSIFLNISYGVIILSSALKKLSGLESGQLLNGVVAIGLVLAEIALFLTVLNSQGVTKFAASARSLLGLAAAVLIISGAIALLSLLDETKLFNGTMAITTVMFTLTAFMYAIKNMKTSKIIAAAAAVNIIAVSLLILTGAVAILASIPLEGLVAGVSALIIVLAAIAGFGALAGISSVMKGLLVGALALLLMIPSLLAIATALKILSTMDWKGFGVAMLSVLGFFVIVTAFGALVGTVPTIALGIAIGSAALLIMAPTLLAFASMMKVLSTIDWKGFGVAMLSLLGFFLIISGFGVISMAIGPGLLMGAAALLIISPALLAFASAMKVLSTLSWGGLAVAAVALLTFVIMLAAIGAVATVVGPGLIALSIAMLGFALSIGVISASLMALSIAFTALATSGIAGALALVAILKIIILGIIKLRYQIATMIYVLVDGFVATLAEVVPRIAENIATLITEILRILSEYTPQIIDYLFDFLIGLIDGINNRLPELIDSVIVLIINIFNGIANGIRDHASDVAAAIKNIFGSLLEAALVILRDLLKDSPITAALKFFGFDLEKSINDSIDQIREIAPPVTAKKKAKEYTKAVADGAKEGKKDIDNTSKSIVEGISENFDTLKDRGRSGGRGLTEEFGKGITDGLPNVNSGFIKMEDAEENFYSKVQLLSGNAGKDSAGFFMDGFIGGLTSKEKLNKVETAAENVGKTAYNKLNMSVQIKSPSKLTEQSGKFFDMGFANGITDNVSLVQTASNLLGKASINSMSEAISKAYDIIDNDMDTTPVIRPVIDLTDVENGANSLNRIFSNQNGSLIGAKFNPLSYYDPNSGSSRTINYGGVSITVNAAQGQNAKEIADAVMERIQIETEQRSRARA